MGSTSQLQAQSDDENSGKGCYGKRYRQNGGGGQDDKEIIKKQKQQDGKDNQWKDNKNYDPSLKSTKQNIVKVHNHVNLGLLVNAQGSNTAKVLTDLGFQATSCGRFMLWGTCGKINCPMSHDDTKLLASQVTKIKDFLNDSSKKLLEQKTKND